MLLSFSFLAQTLHRLVSFAPAVLASAAFFGSVAGADTGAREELRGDSPGGPAPGRGAARAAVSTVEGVDLHAAPGSSCALGGVAGNLDVGGEWYSDGATVAAVGDAASGPRLFAIGAAGTGLDAAPRPRNNRVAARGVCFPPAARAGAAEWRSFPKELGVAPPIKIAGLDSAGLRRCFLSGLRGVAGAWESPSAFARVTLRDSTDSAHPTTGWYVEANLSSSADGSHARVAAVCVDFPRGTTLASGTVSAESGAPVTATLAPGAAACALTGVAGAFDRDDEADGAMIDWPLDARVRWTLAVAGGKSAAWTCAR